MWLTNEATADFPSNNFSQECRASGTLPHPRVTAVFLDSVRSSRSVADGEMRCTARLVVAAILKEARLADWRCFYAVDARTSFVEIVRISVQNFGN